MLDQKQDVVRDRAGDAVARERPLKLQRLSVGNSAEWDGPQLAITHRVAASGVQELPERVERGFRDRFGECRVCVNCEIYLFDGVFVFPCDGELDRKSVV